MNNFDRYSSALCDILKDRINIDNVPDYLYERIKNYSVSELENFLKDSYTDIEPKKITENQTAELKYMQKRGMANIAFLNGIWSAVGSSPAISLIEQYEVLDTTQTYSIEWLLATDKSRIIYVDSVPLKKQYFSTGVFPTEKTNFEFKFNGIKDTAQIKNRTLFGTRESGAENRYTLIISAAGEIQVDIGKIRNYVDFDIERFVNADVAIRLENYELTIKVGGETYKPQISKDTKDGRVVIEKLAYTTLVSPKSLPVGCLQTGEVLQSWSEYNFKSILLYDGTNKAHFKGAYTPEAAVGIYEAVKGTYAELRGV